MGSFYLVFFVSFLCSFFGRFGVRFGVVLGSFLEAKSSQNANLRFLMFRCFSSGFHSVWVSRGCYAHLISLLFSHRVFDRFWVAFEVDFGVVLGSFWVPKPVVFEVDFLMLCACLAKSGPRAAKSASRAPKSGPRAA